MVNISKIVMAFTSIDTKLSNLFQLSNNKNLIHVYLKIFKNDKRIEKN